MKLLIFSTQTDKDLFIISSKPVERKLIKKDSMLVTAEPSWYVK